MFVIGYLKVLGVYLHTLIMGHIICYMFSVLNELTLQ